MRIHTNTREALCQDLRELRKQAIKIEHDLQLDRLPITLACEAIHSLQLSTARIQQRATKEWAISIKLGR